ncbi:hypothetical protein SSUR61_0084 [Streptococcus suis R61]|uniref:Uncharacterized protein n=1 Tax=Streptococcus suis R61 TaxID=996306 RepID=A0AA87F967_STRSU|nr:hypothetical protein SSUR61_0084 [Streptococcus suis R61]
MYSPFPRTEKNDFEKTDKDSKIFWTNFGQDTTFIPASF